MPDLNWNDRIVELPGAHILQTEEWASIKQTVGWQCNPLFWEDDNKKPAAAANLLIRSIRLLKFGPCISIGYIPRGPILDWTDERLRLIVIDEIEKKARQLGLIFIKMDEEIQVARGIPGSDSEIKNDVGIQIEKELEQRGWKKSGEQIQFKNTAVLDLSGTEDDWLKRMKQKARYNLRLSQKNGVKVRIANLAELGSLYHMYAQTASRDGFIIREESYYIEVWKKFIEADKAEALIAEVDGEAVAGLILFFFGKRAWYLYGMSSPRHREKMPNYLLQWEAMRLAKARGCKQYDLWGAPDEFLPSDSMYGVFRFKEGLGAEVVRTSGAWDFPIKPFYCYLYQKVLPKILFIMRWIRKEKLQREVS